MRLRAMAVSCVHDSEHLELFDKENYQWYLWDDDDSLEAEIRAKVRAQATATSSLNRSEEKHRQRSLRPFIPAETHMPEIKLPWSAKTHSRLGRQFIPYQTPIKVLSEGSAKDFGK